MSKRFLINYFMILMLVLMANCDQQPVSNAPEIKRGVTPIADAEVAVIEMEEPVFGKITLELYPNIAPGMVARFKELAREGFYDKTAFHRINNEVIQGGDPLSKDETSKLIGSGKSEKPNIPAEFSDIFYDSGILGAARGESVNSQNCQFFITLKRVNGFDEKYTIFGKVIEGMNNVRTLAGVPRDGERPFEMPKIKSITIQTRK